MHLTGLLDILEMSLFGKDLWLVFGLRAGEDVDMRFNHIQEWSRV
jgi:hypothetical protein